MSSGKVNWSNDLIFSVHQMGLIGNKVTEKDIREELVARGYLKGSIKLDELELTAIERPGWVQIFRFHGFATKQDEPQQELWGLVRDDERHRTEIRIVETEEERQALLEESSQNLISLTRAPLHPVQRWLLWVFLVMVLLVLLSWTLT